MRSERCSWIRKINRYVYFSSKCIGENLIGGMGGWKRQMLLIQSRLSQILQTWKRFFHQWNYNWSFVCTTTAHGIYSWVVCDEVSHWTFGHNTEFSKYLYLQFSRVRMFRTWHKTVRWWWLRHTLLRSKHKCLILSWNKVFFIILSVLPPPTLVTTSTS